MSTEQILKDIRKKFDDEAVFTLNDFADYPVEVIPFGLIDLNLKSGKGGVPRGRVTEIYGDSATGKSTVCSSIIAQAQKQGIQCAYIDTEQALDYDFAKLIGVDPEKLIISQPDTLEEAFGIAEMLIRSGEVGLLVFDSLVGVGSAKEFEEDEFGKANYGTAKLNTLWFRRNLPLIRENNVAVVFTNQVRDLIGAYQATLTTPGGHALRHASSIIIQTSRVKDIKVGDDIIGVEFKANFKKNKLAPPFKTASFEIYFDKGIWREADLLTNAVQYGIVEQAGAYMRYNGDTLGQGRANTLKLLTERPDLFDEIQTALMSTLDKS